MQTQNSAPVDFASRTKGARKKSARRNRLRAKDLSRTRIREVKRDFDITNSTLEAAQNNLLPRSEAVDAVLMQHSDELITVRQEIGELRRQMGIAGSSQMKPFLVARSA